MIQYISIDDSILGVWIFNNAKIRKISFQRTQQQISTTKKSKKDNDIETSKLLCPATFSLLQIPQCKGKKCL